MNPALRIALSVLLVCGLAAVESPRPVPPEVAILLTGISEVEPVEALRRIEAYAGPQHVLVVLARGQARWRLGQAIEAEADFNVALAADPSLNQARIGLAQCAAAREDWLAASRFAAAAINPVHADRELMAFLANTALRAGDARLATLAAQAGILRFPDDQALRRIELAVLVQAGRAEDARQAILGLLAKAPDDVELWRHLAWAAQATHRDDECLAAQEAAMLLAPGDRSLRRQLAEAQLARGLAQAAFITVTPLIGAPPSTEAVAEPSLMLLASRAAAEGGDLAQARAWIAAVPEAVRTRPLHIQVARLAVQAGDEATAAQALDTLIATGEQDPTVLTWAASLAERRDDLARAEMLYLKAGTQPAARLRLAALYLKQQRRDEAATVLATYLVAHPEDAQAKALLARLGR